MLPLVAKMMNRNTREADSCASARVIQQSSGFIPAPAEGVNTTAPSVRHVWMEARSMASRALTCIPSLPDLPHGDRSKPEFDHPAFVYGPAVQPRVCFR